MCDLKNTSPNKYNPNSKSDLFVLHIASHSFLSIQMCICCPYPPRAGALQYNPCVLYTTHVSSTPHMCPLHHTCVLYTSTPCMHPVHHVHILYIMCASCTPHAHPLHHVHVLYTTCISSTPHVHPLHTRCVLYSLNASSMPLLQPP